MRPVLTFSIALLVCQFNPAFGQTAFEVISRMFSESLKVKKMTYTMVKKERVKGSYLVQESNVKLELHPLKTYIYQVHPKKGLEVLFVAGENSDKCLINPNGFPWINLYMDPMGERVLANQHHNIFQSGFEYVISILQHLTQKYATTVNDLITFRSDIRWKEKQVYLVTLNNPNFKYEAYTVQEGETLWSIARSRFINEYMVLEKNPEVKFYNQIKAGQQIILPNDYASKMEILIDKKTYLPISFKVYDDQGLFEEYQYHNLDTNPKFTNLDFSKNHPSYGF